MDSERFETLQVARSKLNELIAKKRLTSSERQKYKLEHIPGTETEIVFGYKVDSYTRFFINSDSNRSQMREVLRDLHLAACFLRGTPYLLVEKKANVPARSYYMCDMLKKYNGITLNAEEVKAWLLTPKEVI